MPAIAIFLGNLIYWNWIFIFCLCKFYISCYCFSNVLTFIWKSWKRIFVGGFVLPVLHFCYVKSLLQALGLFLVCGSRIFTLGSQEGWGLPPLSSLPSSFSSAFQSLLSFWTFPVTSHVKVMALIFFFFNKCNSRDILVLEIVLVSFFHKVSFLSHARIKGWDAFFLSEYIFPSSPLPLPHSVLVISLEVLRGWKER